ncbi:MAG TPA: hypothetical protein DCO77_04155 [Nitrospiraceae bacterium]|nr:hypothetical protein [Nitrospiraceae bacterium]
MLLWPCRGSANPFLSVHIEDNHAGSFYWLAEHLSWDQQYHLLLFDQHSDATEVFNSDFVRTILSKKGGLNDHSAHYTFWNKHGIIQSFNWIEPLLPHPIRNVTWIAGDSLLPREIRSKKAHVKSTINAHEVAVPRSCGDVSDRFSVTDFRRQKIASDFDVPVVVSVDLDYFAGVPHDKADQQFEEIFTYILTLKDLHSVTIAISRPYLKSDDQANRLLTMAIEAFSEIINARIYFEPFAEHGPDRSELAKSAYEDNRQVSYFEISKASSSLISLLLQNPSRYAVHYKRNKWEALLKTWRNRYKQPVILLSKRGKTFAPKKCNYFLQDDAFEVYLNTGFDRDENVSVTWKAVASEGRSYNIIGQNNYGFANDASKYILFKTRDIDKLKNSRRIHSYQLRHLFDSMTGAGSIRLYAEVSKDDDYFRSPVLCISKYMNEGYTGKLTEILNLPYILGSGLLNVDNATGADAQYGADCLDFISYGKRRQGYAISYLNQNNFRKFLAKVDDVLSFKNGIAYNARDTVAVDAQMIDDGLLLHFNSHVAALYQDNDPKNILDGGDLVIHQLENYPEIVPLSNLKQARRPFLLMKFKKP